ncbi:MAG TPA: hypothetical protein VLU96_11065 [Gaiellaceae bacterium]|nr:hypothetical protein [Gaiellaceae bacterium]
MRRTIALVLATLVGAALADEPARAATLQENPSLSSAPSFWDPLNWLPNATPGSGDSLHLLGFHRGAYYLGDVTGGPSAQTGQIRELHYQGPNGFETIYWGSNFAGGNAGGLTFSNDDPNDPGVGIRVGWTTVRTALNTLQLMDAEIPASSPVNIALGWTDAFSQPTEAAFGNRLVFSATSVGSSAPVHTVNAGIANLQSDYSFLDINPNMALVAASLRTESPFGALPNTGSQVHVAGGALSADDAFFFMHGSGNTPLVVDQNGRADFGQLRVQVDGTGSPGSAATVSVLDGTLTANDAILQSYSGGTVGLEVNGGQVVTANKGGDGLDLSTDGGSAHLTVSHGGQLSGVTSLSAYDFSGAPGDAQFRASDPNTVVRGRLDLTVEGTSTGLVRFSKGASCESCALSLAGGTLELGSSAQVKDSSLVLSQGAAANVVDTASVSFNSIQLTPEATSFTITNSNPPLGTVDVSVGTLNIGSDLVLHGDGTKDGGDLTSSGGAQLTVGPDTRLRVGIAGQTDLPLLALGSGGRLTLDPHGAAFIGSPGTPDDYREGMLVVGPGGSLYGKGRIDGLGFGAGTNPDLVNAGGDVNGGFSPGTLTIEGGYLQESGILDLEIGGVGTGQYDVLDATLGATFLGGTIRFERLDGFLGELGAQLDFFAGRPVSFDPGVAFEDDTGLGLQFDLATGVATITHVVPEPPLTALLLAFAAPLAWLRRRDSRQFAE